MPLPFRSNWFWEVLGPQLFLLKTAQTEMVGKNGYFVLTNMELQTYHVCLKQIVKLLKS